MKFEPKTTEPLMFPMPMKLKGINKGMLAINKTIQGEGLQPSFIIIPHEIDFKYKVVSNGDKSFPKSHTVTLQNPDLYQIAWHADTSEIDVDKIFSVKPNSGTIPSGEEVEITVYFNP
jgi:hypothetical protein